MPANIRWELIQRLKGLAESFLRIKSHSVKKSPKFFRNPQYIAILKKKPTLLRFLRHFKPVSSSSIYTVIALMQATEMPTEETELDSRQAKNSFLHGARTCQWVHTISCLTDEGGYLPVSRVAVSLTTYIHPVPSFEGARLHTFTSHHLYIRRCLTTHRHSLTSPGGFRPNFGNY